MKKQIELTQKNHPLSLRTVVEFLMNKQGYTIKENYNTSDKGEVFIMESKEERLYSLDELEKTFYAGREYFVDDFSWSFEDWLKELK